MLYWRSYFSASLSPTQSQSLLGEPNASLSQRLPLSSIRRCAQDGWNPRTISRKGEALFLLGEQTHIQFFELCGRTARRRCGCALIFIPATCMCKHLSGRRAPRGMRRSIRSFNMVITVMTSWPIYMFEAFLRHAIGLTYMSCYLSHSGTGQPCYSTLWPVTTKDYKSKPLVKAELQAIQFNTAL